MKNKKMKMIAVLLGGSLFALSGVVLADESSAPREPSVALADESSAPREPSVALTDESSAPREPSAVA